MSGFVDSVDKQNRQGASSPAFIHYSGHSLASARFHAKDDDASHKQPKVFKKPLIASSSSRNVRGDLFRSISSCLQDQVVMRQHAFIHQLFDKACGTKPSASLPLSNQVVRLNNSAQAIAK